MQNESNRVEETKRKIRKYVIQTVMNEYEHEKLHLTRENQKQKYSKMLMSPFQFYRGSAYLFYFDVMRMPLSFHTPKDKPVWLQGDLHFENFGAFMNENGRIVYDTNDFDEGYLGSYLYDVLRMATSIALYGEELGYDEETQKDLIKTYLRAYYEQLKVFAEGEADPSSFVFRKENTEGPVSRVLEALEARNAEELLENVTTVEDGMRKFIESEKLERLSTEERLALEEAWPEYIDSLDAKLGDQREFFAIKDVVKKHGSGTGSIGLNRYYILVEGEKDGQQRDDIVLEAKEARKPVPAHFHAYDAIFGEEEPHHGKRVVLSQRAMHYLQDPFLGYFTIDDHHFYVRENSPYVGEVERGHLENQESIEKTVEIMGKVTAKIHARADVDSEIEALDYESEKEILKAINGDFNRFSSELLLWSVHYKNQVHEDFNLFSEWCKEEFALDTEKIKVK